MPIVRARWNFVIGMVRSILGFETVDEVNYEHSEIVQSCIPVEWIEFGA